MAVTGANKSKLALSLTVFGICLISLYFLSANIGNTTNELLSTTSAPIQFRSSPILSQFEDSTAPIQNLDQQIAQILFRADSLASIVNTSEQKSDLPLLINSLQSFANAGSTVSSLDQTIANKILEIMRIYSQVVVDMKAETTQQWIVNKNIENIDKLFTKDLQNVQKALKDGKDLHTKILNKNDNSAIAEHNAISLMSRMVFGVQQKHEIFKDENQILLVRKDIFDERVRAEKAENTVMLDEAKTAKTDSGADAKEPAVMELCSEAKFYVRFWNWLKTLVKTEAICKDAVEKVEEKSDETKMLNLAEVTAVTETEVLEPCKSLGFKKSLFGFLKKIYSGREYCLDTTKKTEKTWFDLVPSHGSDDSRIILAENQNDARMLIDLVINVNLNSKVTRIEEEGLISPDIDLSENKNFFTDLVDFYQMKGLNMIDLNEQKLTDLATDAPRFTDLEMYLNSAVGFLDRFERSKVVLSDLTRLDKRMLKFVERLIMQWASYDDKLELFEKFLSKYVRLFEQRVVRRLE